MNERDRTTLEAVAHSLQEDPSGPLLRDERRALSRNLPAMLAALRFVEEHGEVLKGALSSTADAAEGGLFPDHVARLDAAHAALSAIRSFKEKP